MTRPDALILAGGRGRRMGGVGKGLLEVEPGESVLARTLRAIGPQVNRSYIVAPEAPDLSALNAPETGWLPDPGTGPANAMISAARALETELVFVFASDLPAVSSALLDWLERAWTTEDEALVPVHEGRSQPLFGLYRRPSLATRQLPEGASVGALLEGLRWRGLSSAELPVKVAEGLLGFNTWEEAETWGIQRAPGLANEPGPQG